MSPCNLKGPYNGEAGGPESDSCDNRPEAQVERKCYTTSYMDRRRSHKTRNAGELQQLEKARK